MEKVVLTSILQTVRPRCRDSDQTYDAVVKMPPPPMPVIYQSLTKVTTTALVKPIKREPTNLAAMSISILFASPQAVTPKAANVTAV